MKQNYTSHTSSLFLIELILALFFFSVASAICVQLFAKAHLLSNEAELLTISVNECSNAAEIIRSSDSYSEIEERLKNAYPQGSFQEHGFQHADENGCVMNLVWEYSTGRIYAEISYQIVDPLETIYELTIEHLLTGELP